MKIVLTTGAPLEFQQHKVSRAAFDAAAENTFILETFAAFFFKGLVFVLSFDHHFGGLPVLVDVHEKLVHVKVQRAYDVDQHQQ